jgi:hypothetical protein
LGYKNLPQVRLKIFKKLFFQKNPNHSSTDTYVTDKKVRCYKSKGKIFTLKSFAQLGLALPGINFSQVHFVRNVYRNFFIREKWIKHHPKVVEKIFI